MGGAGWWQNRKNHEARIPAGQRWAPVLRQRRPSAGSFALEHAVTNCVPVSQDHQAAGKNDAGTKAETDGSGATAEEVSASGLDYMVHCKEARWELPNAHSVSTLMSPRRGVPTGRGDYR